MKILHCPTTVGGNPQGLSKSERELGHESESLTLSQTVYQYPTNHVVWSENDNIFTREYKRWKAIRHSLQNYDVIHYNFGTSLAPRKGRGEEKGFLKFIKPIYHALYGGIFSCWDLKRAKKKNIVTAVTYQGSDARQGWYCKKNYKIHFCHNDNDIYTPKGDAVKQEQIKQFDQYVDLIYSVNPDLLNVLPKRTKFTPYASVDPRDWTPKPLPKTPNDIPHIVHAPSNREIKGTKYILEAFKRLKKEGVPFRYTLVEGLPNKEAREVYETADILIDQLLAGYYGSLSVELMALAKPVICYIRDEDMHHMPPDMVKNMPIINATPDSIYDVLKTYLTTDKDKLREIGLNSRRYVGQFHDPIKIATQLTIDYKKVQEQKNKKVLFILRNHFTNDSRVLKEATTLISAGYDVTIRCLWDQKLKKLELINNIKIERITYSQQQTKKYFAKKIIKILEYTYHVIKNSSQFSIIHCHDLDTLPIGVIIKWISFGSKKLVYDAHEYETERHHISGFLKFASKITERFFIRFADSVINVSEGIAEEYVRLYNITKPKLILNCPLYRKTVPSQDIFRKKFGIKKDQIIFLYQGGLGVNRGIEETLETFIKLNDPNKVIVFMGYGPLEKSIKEAAKKYDHIFYHNAVTPNVLLDYTSSADIGIIFYENTCLNHYYCLPNKLFEYTMAELPVIISDLYELNKIINKYQNGITVKKGAGNFEKAVRAITVENISQYKKNIPDIKNTYNWEEQEKVLLSIYKNL